MFNSFYLVSLHNYYVSFSIVQRFLCIQVSHEIGFLSMFHLSRVHGMDGMGWDVFSNSSSVCCVASLICSQVCV